MHAATHFHGSFICLMDGDFCRASFTRKECLDVGDPDPCESSTWLWSAYLWVVGHYIMKLSGFWVLLLVLQTSLLTFFFPSYINASSSSDMGTNPHHVESNEYLFAPAIPLNRKLKTQIKEHNGQMRKKVQPSDLNVDDYHPVDPVPSSKTSVKPGPIEHGAPLMPRIPNPSPPDQPQPGDFA